MTQVLFAQKSQGFFVYMVACVRAYIAPRPMLLVAIIIDVQSYFNLRDFFVATSCFMLTILCMRRVLFGERAKSFYTAVVLDRRIFER